MSGKINRRRVRKRRRGGEKTGMKFVTVLVIMIIAVLLGYLTARYVIGPLLGYDADESPITITGGDEIDESKDGYALQFGVFSSRESAEDLVSELESKGIEAEVTEADGKFKVISPVLETKGEAVDKLESIRDKDVEDVFIASF